MAILFLENNKFEEVKVAATKEEQKRGLMFVKSPHLLLFPYKEAKVKKFWMKNVPSYLDIIFCKQGKVIYICEGFPFNEELLGPDEKTDLVLEAPLGFVQYYNVKVGSKIKVKYNVEEIMNILKKGS
jgi:uncharacterized membrane protein (UPF0127 family)